MNQKTTRAEGTVFAAGTKLDAANLNAEFGHVKTELDAINTILESFIYSGVVHNSIYRGKYLGTSVTTAQYTAISAGTFEDLYIGDYRTICCWWLRIW